MLPNSVFGEYVPPNADGVRVGPAIPFPLIPEGIKQCVPGYENCFVNVTSGISHSWSFPCSGGPYVNCLPIYNVHELLFPLYWDDWNSPDDDDDGVVDNPYTITGSANNQDIYPLVEPIQNHFSLIKTSFFQENCNIFTILTQIM